MVAPSCRQALGRATRIQRPAARLVRHSSVRRGRHPAAATRRFTRTGNAVTQSGLAVRPDAQRRPGTAPPSRRRWRAAFLASACAGILAITAMAAAGVLGLPGPAHPARTVPPRQAVPGSRHRLEGHARLRQATSSPPSATARTPASDSIRPSASQVPSAGVTPPTPTPRVTSPAYPGRAPTPFVPTYPPSPTVSGTTSPTTAGASVSPATSPAGSGSPDTSPTGSDSPAP